MQDDEVFNDCQYSDHELSIDSQQNTIEVGSILTSYFLRESSVAKDNTPTTTVDGSY